MDINKKQNILAISNSINYKITLEDINKYYDYHENNIINKHNLMIGLLFDNKWNLHIMDIYQKLDLIGKEFQNNYDSVEFYQKINNFNFKYLNHFILKKENYKSFLKSIYWKSIKEVKEMDHYLCQLCGKYLQYNDINIHHSTYAIRGFEHLPSIRNKNLLALCKSCHKLFHDNKNASQGL